jgi:glyoxylase-like metal-dependent hydrolase (beta-lactamase superfamily II)
MNFAPHRFPTALALLLAVPGLIAASSAWTPVKTIDFSAKHDVLLRNADGTLTPMDVPYYKATLIAPGTWQIESDGDYHYLLEGDSEALAIDTGYGAGNLREYLQTLTRKPVRYVANTHDHFDHTANNAYFDKAFMSEKTAEKATIPFSTFDGITFPRNYPKEIIGDGWKYQLGNREIEAFLIPNHTAGGTAYLDRRTRILFSGDEIFRGTATIGAAGTVAQYEKNLTKLAAHRSEFDSVATGFWGLIEATWMDKLLENARYILAGHEGEPVTPQQRRPAALSTSPLTYQRRSPRGGDAGGGVQAPPNPNLRRMSYADVTITYDAEHIR